MGVGRWVRDYGAFFAALLAAVLALVNGLLAVRREHRARREDWLREQRSVAYSRFLTSAQDFQRAITFAFAEFDTGDDPVGLTDDSADVEKHARELARVLGELHLLGPPEAYEAALAVRQVCWEYKRTLESSPDRYSDVVIDKPLGKFIDIARRAIDT